MEDTRLLGQQAVVSADDVTKLLNNDYDSCSSLEVAEAHSFKNGYTIKADTEVPQGRHLGFFSIVVLFVSRMVGSGIFATPSSILMNCGGNIKVFTLIWGLAALSAYAGMYLFLEFGSWLPKSGGRKNFLEQAYDRPYLMMSVSFSCYSVLTNYTMANSIIFGKYLFTALNIQDSSYSKIASICIILLVIFIHGTSVRRGVKIQNTLGFLKLVMIFMMCALGIYATAFSQSSTDHLNSNESGLNISPKPATPSSIVAAFISAFYCFSGWDSVHAVSSEIKNPNRTLKLAGPVSFLICICCYASMNIAYLRIMTYEEIVAAGPLVGSLLFTKLFGKTVGSQLMSLTIMLSSASNIFVVLYGISRMNQEVFREGYLPFSSPLSKNWPKDAPLPSLLVAGILTITWLSIVPSEGSSFDYLVNMEGYGNQFFLLLIAIGLFVYRSKNSKTNPPIKAYSMGVLLIILVAIYVLFVPFTGDQSSMKVGILPPYYVSALLLIGVCFFYWLTSFVLMPKIFGYNLVPEKRFLDDGLSIVKWRKKYISS